MKIIYIPLNHIYKVRLLLQYDKIHLHFCGDFPTTAIVRKRFTEHNHISSKATFHDLFTGVIHIDNNVNTKAVCE